MERMMWMLAGAGVVAYLAAGGIPAALGFGVGASFSVLNFRWLKKGVSALGETQKPPRLRSAVFLGSRYLVLGAVLYGMMKFFGISLMAVLAGLLVPVAAVFIEILYELIYART
jgi:hypothetical protein